MIIINYRDDFPSHILAAGDVAAVCLLVVCFFPFMFLQVLLTIPCMGAVCFLFSPQMQQLVTQFFTIGVYLFKLSPLLSLQTPFSFNLSNKKKVLFCSLYFPLCLHSISTLSPLSPLIEPDQCFSFYVAYC